MSIKSKQIRVHIETSKRLDNKKVIPEESYDSVINRELNKNDRLRPRKQN